MTRDEHRKTALKHLADAEFYAPTSRRGEGDNPDWAIGTFHATMAAAHAVLAGPEPEPQGGHARIPGQPDPWTPDWGQPT